MRAGAAIAPPAEVRSQRASVGRMVILALAYLAILVGVAAYPLASPLRDIWKPVSPFGTAADTLLDVDGETIAIEVRSAPEIVYWLSTADRIVNSIRFLYRQPIETSPVSSSGLP